MSCPSRAPPRSRSGGHAVQDEINVREGDMVVVFQVGAEGEDVAPPASPVPDEAAHAGHS